MVAAWIHLAADEDSIGTLLTSVDILMSLQKVLRICARVPG